MTRAHVTVRDAVPQDMPELLELFGELRAAGPKRLPRGVGDPTSMRVVAEARYRRSFEEPEERLLVAVDRDERIVGMTLLTLGPVSSMNDARSVMMGHFTVRTSIRRRGIGRALVAAATAWADEMGVDGVGVAISMRNLVLVPVGMAAGAAIGHALQLTRWHRAGLVELPVQRRHRGRRHRLGRHAAVGGRAGSQLHQGRRACNQTKGTKSGAIRHAVTPVRKDAALTRLRGQTQNTFFSTSRVFETARRHR